MDDTKIMTDTLKIERAITGLTEWQKHVQTGSDIDRDISVAVEVLKAQLDTDVPDTNIGNMVDTISRQAAIDIERNATVDTNPMHFEAHQKFTQFMDDAEISSFGRWQWSNGFNTALTAIGIDLKKLPPAQIHCKDCRYWDTLWQNDYAPNYHYCPIIDGTCGGDFYCADAERKVTE